MRIIDFVWGRVTATLATVALAILSSVGDPRKSWTWENAFGDDRPWEFIFGLAIFLVAHSWVSWRREQKRIRRLASNREVIQSTVLHLISDLSNLAGRNYDLWMVDLYFKKTVWRLTLRCPFLRCIVLERDSSISISDVTKLPGLIDTADALFGYCVRESEAKIWWNPNLAQTTLPAHNSMDDLQESANDALNNQCGVIKVWPIADHKRLTCSGILVVHARPETAAATTALGALVGGGADRYLARASTEIYNHLAL